jgi:hypothetical protein
VNAKEIKSLVENTRPVHLVRHCDVEDGILRIHSAEAISYIQNYQRHSKNTAIVKFVPASGAATRMFAGISAVDFDNISADAEAFFLNLEKLPFFDELESEIERQGLNYLQLKEDGRWNRIIHTILSTDHLGYLTIPKGLVPFHKYPACNRSAFNEHLVEGSHYLSLIPQHHVHFTIDQAYHKQIAEHISAFQSKNSSAIQQVSFSVQNPESHLPAFDEHFEPARNLDGSLFLRPAGHGALLENLQALEGECVFIQNIDNITEESHHSEVATYRMLIGGILLGLVHERNTLLNQLEQGNELAIDSAVHFYKKHFNRNYSEESPSSKELFLLLNRPIRVCGMVENHGEAGGGPFWVKDTSGEVIKQIVEKAQVNHDDPEQHHIFQESSHFNPVDLVCHFLDHQGKKYNLEDFRNISSSLISEKFIHGRKMKIIELPGLWNGSMWGWNSAFVEIPSSIFHPVKSVTDLLKEGHLPKE